MRRFWYRLWAWFWHTGTWETHPCKVPNIKTDDAMAVKGRVWKCWCGRRWKFLRIGVKEEDNRHRYDETRYWQERTPEIELKEAQDMLAALEKGEHDAITGPARERIDSGTGSSPIRTVERRGGKFEGVEGDRRFPAEAVRRGYR